MEFGHLLIFMSHSQFSQCVLMPNPIDMESIKAGIRSDYQRLVERDLRKEVAVGVRLSNLMMSIYENKVKICFYLVIKVHLETMVCIRQRFLKCLYIV
ncbi:MAG: hypothetical protein B6D70_10125 [gamma proteobacterium symbiont of Stewartia floridana]|nr:MAG: hypothetical protein B6D75_16150 [gamma proteobacterium symbiont of Stewartia floridana]RLW60856.1 MAG: hypothetical protein B6D70_10125 [gamma proteobacterium symbiont of Stewartia floridana]RLW63404.1 MAG: hypothetical protein B6D73_15650 [gamma proteobacterium symbiont of Stewartia floridana]RLW69973.1 MAG: hypothetical protein B6D71_08220 [gamma proteobacterium symbiont of Stewartia floridana]